MYSNFWSKSALRLSTLASAMTVAPSTWAQEAMCQLALGYSPVTTANMAPSPVPGLGIVGIGLLAGAVGMTAWRKSRRAGGQGRQVLSVALLASGAFLLSQGTDSVMRSVHAAGPYELSNPNGGNLTFNDIPSPAPLITVTNTSGVRLRITSNGNATESGTCTEGSELVPNGTCTTQAICPTPPQPVSIQVTSDPEVTCDTTAALYTVEWQSSDGSTGSAYSVYGPVISQQPTFDPDSPAPDVSLSYPERPRLTLDENGYAQNLAAATAYTATVTATAPEGHGFGNPPQPTTSWSFSFAGDSDSDDASRVCYTAAHWGSL